MNVVLPLIHLDNLVFTPLPQLLLKQQLILDGVCTEDEVIILEYSREDDLAAVFGDIISFNPVVCGFSVYVWNAKFIQQLSKAIKDYYGDKVIVAWGGPQVSEKPEWFAKTYKDCVDYVFGWYGELNFSNVVKQIKEGNLDSANIPAYTAEHVAVGAKAIDFDDMPLPYKKEWMPKTVTDHIGERVALLETYRNCPFSCAYCLWGKAANKIEGRPYDLVMRDFNHLLDLGFKHFKFADAGLGLIRPRDKQLFRKMADMRLDKMGVHLRTYFFWMVIDEEWAEIFKELIGQGVIGQLDVGMQTFNPKALVDMHRPTDYKRFDRVMEILQRHKVPYSIDLIVGLPGDDLNGFKHSIRECIRYKPKRFQSFLCSVLPGSNYDLEREKLGIKTIRGSLMDDDEKIIETKSFPKDDMKTALDLEAWLYMAFSMQLCDAAMNKVSEITEINQLTIVENLKSWSIINCPHLTKMIGKYRKNLYDSRQKGRVECDQYLFDHFSDIYKELMAYASIQGVEEEMRDCLLRFPKTWLVGLSLVGIDGITIAKGQGVAAEGLKCGNYVYKWKEDPIPGVVGTKYAFWVWQRVDDLKSDLIEMT